MKSICGVITSPNYLPISSLRRPFNGEFQPTTHWEPFVAAIMMRCPEPPKREWTDDSQHNSNWDPHSSKFTLLLLLRPVTRFQGLRGQNTFLGGHDSCFYDMLKMHFTGNSKIWGYEKIWGAVLRLPPWLRACYFYELKVTYGVITSPHELRLRRVTRIWI